MTGTIGGFAVSGDAASDVLEVIQLLPFSKSFDGPTTATGAATLTFTITNPGTDTASDISFSDDLNAVIPGLIATSLPALPCGAGSSITGISFLTFTGGELAPMSMCSFDIDVLVPMTATAGTYPNTTSDLTQQGLKVADPANDDLVIEPPPTFAKAFAPSAIGIGQTSTLTFTIDNTASAVVASALAFTDNLPAGIEVAATPNASTTCTGGTVTAAAGTGTISHTVGTVGAGASCTVQADVTATAIGALLNTTGDLTSSSGNSGTASDTLTVNPQPGFAKAFAPDTIVIGGISTLTFTVNNTGSTVDATALAFTDNLPAAITVATPANVVNGCGGTVTAVSGTSVISLTGGTAAALASCTVSVDTTSVTSGMHINLSGDLTSSLGNSGTATDALTVIPPPSFAKLFAPNPIAAGDISTLVFTISNGGSTVDATGLAFTDNLPAGLVVATPANASTTCIGGTLTAVAGSGVIAYTGGTVMAATQCTVQADVTTNVPGSYVNTTGDLTSSLGNSGPAMDTLDIDFAALGFTKAFAPTIIQPGEISTLTLTIDNPINGVAVANLAFTDTLPAGMVVATPANATTTCTGGTVTAAPGSGVVSYAGGSVGGNTSCTVSVDVVGNTVGDLVNTTGDLTSDAGTTASASATLTVIEMISLTKEFLSDPVLRGGLVDIQFTIANRGATMLTQITFTDDLDAALSGLAAVGLPVPDVCGAGSSVAGTSVITLTGGTVAPGQNCVFAVSAKVPADAALGVYTNTTSAMGALADGVPVASLPASADFEVVFLEFSKDFADESVVGGFTTTLTFTISNPDPANAATGITFMDDLDAVLPGMTAVGLPMADVCGVGSSVAGTSLVTLTDGMVGPGATCSFGITVMVPETAPMGTVTNVTSVLQAVVDGSAATGDAAGVAMADLMIEFNILQVPTLGTWGALFLALLLAIVAVRRLSFR